MLQPEIFAAIFAKIFAMFRMLQCITGNYATITNYLAVELRYMGFWGIRPKTRSTGQGTPGYQ